MVAALADDLATARLLRLALGRGDCHRPRGGAEDGFASAGVLSALSQLKAMSIAASGSGSGSSGVPVSAPQSAKDSQRGGAPSAAAPGAPGGTPRGLQVERDAGWLVESGGRISGMLAKVIPPLCMHPSAQVREAVAAAATKMLRCCGRDGGALGEEGARLLMEAALTLAQDEYHQVIGVRPCTYLSVGHNKCGVI